jgi:hypothetical protein
MPVDEPHGSLFAYFRIFAPLADDHVIASHLTSITQPMLTFADDFRSFAMIFTFRRRLALIATPGSAPCNTAEVLRFSKTVAKDTGMSVHQNSKAVSAYRFGLMMWR